MEADQVPSTRSFQPSLPPLTADHMLSPCGPSQQTFEHVSTKRTGGTNTTDDSRTLEHLDVVQPSGKSIMSMAHKGLYINQFNICMRRVEQYTRPCTNNPCCILPQYDEWSLTNTQWESGNVSPFYSPACYISVKQRKIKQLSRCVWTVSLRIVMDINIETIPIECTAKKTTKTTILVSELWWNKYMKVPQI